MNITDVKIFPVREAKLKAYVSIILDQSFMVNDLKIIQGREGLFISMPSRRRRNGTYRDIAHPLNSETRQVLQTRVLAAYQEVIESGDGATRVAPVGKQEKSAPAGELPASSMPLAPAVAAAASSTVAPAATPDAGPVSPSVAAAAEAVERAPIAAPDSVPAATPDRSRSEAEVEQTLREIEEAHLSDSFWTVS